MYYPSYVHPLTHTYLHILTLCHRVLRQVSDCLVWGGARRRESPKTFIAVVYHNNKQEEYSSTQIHSKHHAPTHPDQAHNPHTNIRRRK
jgi:hypothetical protein